MEFANLIPFWKAFLSGLLVTVELSVIAIVGGLLIGILTSSVLTVKNNTLPMRVLKAIVKVYVAMFRGAPLLILLFFGYYGIAYLGVDMPIFAACSYVLCLYGGAYICEIIRSGIESIPTGQYEAAQLLGYNKSQTFFKIVLPQVVKIVLPSVTNEVITLVKDTSLVYSVSYIEMFALAKQIAAAQTTVLPFVIAGVFYYVFNFVVAWVMEWLEKKMNYYR